jgi:hypothetical protein
VDEGQGIFFSPSEVKKILFSVFSSYSRFKIQKMKEREGYLLRVAYLLVEDLDKDGREVIKAAVTMEISSRRRTEFFPLRANILAISAPFDKERPKKRMYKRHLSRAFKDAVRILNEELRLLQASNSELLLFLKRKEPELKVMAIRLLGERKVKASVPKLIRLLKDRQIRDVVIGALVAIGDQRAVKPLIEGADTQNIKELIQVIDAISSLGGKEAIAYLEFIAAGHSDPYIRYLARSGRKRIKQ